MKLTTKTLAFLAGASGMLLAGSAAALDEVSYGTNWLAEAEHGGFYQAKATGLYEKAGLDVTIKMGGPQVNALQLLLAGETDIMMGYDIQVLKALEQNIPITTIAASFQFDLQGVVGRITDRFINADRVPTGERTPLGDGRNRLPGRNH